VPSTGRTSLIVGVLEVVEGDVVMAVSAGGRVTRIEASSVPSQGRRTQGRHVVKLPAGDRVVEVTRAVGPGSRREREATEGRGASDDSNGDEGQLDLLDVSSEGKGKPT